MKPKIYTYYTPVPGIGQFDSMQLILMWRKNWAEAGWETFVLNEYQAQQHPYWTEFQKAATTNLPSINPPGYDLACWYRWLALAVVGGGWMVDYDVFITKPEEQGWWRNVSESDKQSKILIHQTPCCPCLVHCLPELAEQFLRAAAPGTIGRQRMPDGKPHYSDQYTLEDLAMKTTPWIEVRDVVKLWSDKGWEKAPVVHYSNSVCQPHQKMPKWQHIPGLMKP